MPQKIELENNLITEAPIGSICGKLPYSFQQDKRQQVQILTLTDGLHLDSTLYRLEKGWIVEFRLGPSLLGKKITIFCNHPSSANEEFQRRQYRALEWQYGSLGEVHNNSCNDDTAIFAQLPIKRAGSFHYYFTEEGSDQPRGSGYFTVDPVLAIGNREDEVLPLDSVQCQTVLAKSLGAFEDWNDRLRVSKESGYNVIHFTPIQALGDSNSSYSLKDQLKLNPVFSSEKVVPTFEDVFKLTEKMRREWKVLSICDVVLNHTANESPWLLEHPECTYNMITSPHLISAAVLDANLYVFTKDVSEGKFEGRGIPNEVYTQQHVDAIKNYLQTELVPNLLLHELYTCDVEVLAQKFNELAKKSTPTRGSANQSDLILIRDPNYRRNSATVDLNLAVQLFNVHRNDVSSEEERLTKCTNDFKQRLYEINAIAKHEIEIHLNAAVNNCIQNINYFRLQDDGPKLRKVSERFPLVPRYFTGNFKDYKSIENEIYGNGQFVMAHNGWVMNSDPLKNFADPDSNVYIRRELIAWGDSVKLRFGESPADCPFLWSHMRKYVEQTALLFDGIRLDNCHSTPLPVAEYLLDCARKIRPDLYVVAELFTNSDSTDNIFVNRLGITSLIREAMSAWDSHELGRLVYRYGGEPAGSFYSSPVRPLVPSIAHALFLDVSHDNPSPVSKRSVFDLIPSSALVAMACCASGSTRGYDELVPHHIHVVDETRAYTSWTEEKIIDNSRVNNQSGIIAAKKALNKLHQSLSEEGYNQVFVDQMNENVVAVTRHNPKTHETVVLVSYTAFSHPNDYVPAKPDIRDLRVEGVLSEIILECSFRNKSKDNPFGRFENFKQDERFINGLTEYEVTLKENIKIEESNALQLVSNANDKIARFEFKVFQPGSVVAVRVLPHLKVKPNFDALDDLANSFLDVRHEQTLLSLVSELNLGDLNYALYRCSEEDMEEGTGSYNIPSYGNLVYCGLQGFVSALNNISLVNDLGHPICHNLRQGDWMLDYVSGRLKSEKGTLKLGLWLQAKFEFLRQLPRYLIPRYFEIIINGVHQLLISRSVFLMNDFIKCGSTFVRGLALGSVQCSGIVGSAPLPPFTPSLLPKDDNERKITLSAGLPHFATGYMRCWGRDTFIALRGLFILTGRFKEARYHILGFAGCLRHGLIPNLLDRGVNARFNCRDAVWWWLYSIVSYIELAPEGQEILKDPVSRIFPNDDSPPMGPGVVEQPLFDVMQEALTVHFEGLAFRERNAGPAIDAHMSDLGFNNNIGVNLETGFVFGGNEYNCGTWMDKMGSSNNAGNKGRPATPRDGSAVELVALCKTVLRELVKLNERGVYPYSSVERVDAEGTSITEWSFKQWEEKIAANFEKHFWIPASPETSETRPDLIHRRGIYKDSVGATQPWADYQLRPNFLIALVVAPEMLDPVKAWTAIQKAEQILLGPLGMKTLDPADWNYNGDYNNDNDGNDIKIAHGFNYHQGPEWLWPVGYFLRAKLHFAKLRGESELKSAISQIRSYLSTHYNELTTSHWRGLPELTNKDGAYCSGSCRVQAWSMGCILEVLYDLHILEKESKAARLNSEVN